MQKYTRISFALLFMLCHMLNNNLMRCSNKFSELFAFRFFFPAAMHLQKNYKSKILAKLRFNTWPPSAKPLLKLQFFLNSIIMHLLLSNK